jgi:OmcA/MtrC family decaheme c-type cytochrome
MTNATRLTVLSIAALAAACSGSNGAAGTSCSVTDNHDGTATLHCTDGSSFTVSNGQNGRDGQNGKDGTDGTVGMTGTSGASCTLLDNHNGTRTLSCGDGGTITVVDAVVDYAVMTADEKAQSAMAAVVTNVAFPADGRPVVTLRVTERHGLGVKNLATTAVTWRFALLKLAPGAVDTTPGVNGSANDTWVSYLAANDHSAASSETAAAANLVDHGDGTYDYRFAKVINAGPTAAGTSYEPDRPHRLIVLLYASGNPFAPVNLVRELVPATGADVTGQHDSVDGNACLECHTSFRAITGGTGQFGTGEFHGGVRYDIRTCVACHNDQRRFSSSGDLLTEPSFATASDGSVTWTGTASVLNREAVLDLPVFIHKIHMGKKLTLTGGTYAGVPQPYETTYPQDIRNCTKCHRAPAPLADHFKTQPSSRACGACHDDRSFDATVPPGRVAHHGGPQATDIGCGTCHQAGSVGGDVALMHTPVSPPNAHNIYADATSAGNSNTNAAWVAAAGAVPPRAQVITYVVGGVSTWTDAAANVQRPQISFKFKLDGKDVVFPDPATATELIPNFVGSPSAYFVFAVPQDGVAAPADFNASASAYIRNVWNGTGTCSNAASTTTRTGAGTMTGPDANGFYTLRLSCAIVPANATMLTGGIGYTYGLGSRQSPSNPDLDFVNNTQPFTQVNLDADYPYVPNKKADGVTPSYGGVGGLIVPPPDVSMVATGFTGRRAIVDNTKCDSCHVSLGVGPDFHAGQRNDAGTCNWCHRPNQTSSAWSANQKDFVHAIHGAEKRQTPFTWHEESPTEGFWETTYPGVLNKCEMCHLPGTYDFSTTATQAAYPNMLASTVGQGTYAAGSVHSPYVAEATNYGAGFSYNALTGAIVNPDPTTLVVSPMVAACSACHDSPSAVDHMQTNGGSFFEARSAAFTKPQKEECLICHGPGRVAAIADIHAVAF